MSKPVLWHIPISHYNEKVRWALAWKRIEHERRAPPPGAHMAVALWLTRGAHKTFPVLTLDGRGIGDSTAIIAALEQRTPEPPLYPDDAEPRRRALELEDFFDEQLGPAIRLLVWHELTTVADGSGVEPVALASLPAALTRTAAGRKAATLFGSSFVSLRYRVKDKASAAAARTKVAEAMDRLEAELGEGDYLVGDRFTVADLTAAALFYPLVQPPEGPQAGLDMPPSYAAYIEQFRDRRGYAWVAEMFRRHRKQPAAT